MKNLRRNFERFCYKHRDWGIPNLMLYICLGSALVYLFSLMMDSTLLYYWLCFDRHLILQGQIWRLITYPLTMSFGGFVRTAIFMLCYYSLGRAIENLWGTFRFNLFYLTGVVLMDIYCMIFGGYASVDYLNLSLFLAYATLYPDSHFLLLYIIPVKAWILALADLVLHLYGVVIFPFPENIFPVISLANYFLFFGKDVANVIPLSWRANFRRLLRRQPLQKKERKPHGPQIVRDADGPRVVPFPDAGSYEATVATPKAPYTHRCTVCGRTDVSDPDLEFRYCSRCNGYHCYCEDHIRNHAHIE